MLAGGNSTSLSAAIETSCAAERTQASSTVAEQSRWEPTVLHNAANELWFSEAERALALLDQAEPILNDEDARIASLLRLLAIIDRDGRVPTDAKVANVDAIRLSELSVEQKVELAYSYVSANQHGAAIKAARTALSDQRFALSQPIVRTLANEVLATALGRSGQLDEAIDLLQKERWLLELSLGCNHPYLQRAYRTEVSLLYLADRYLESYDLALRTLRKSAEMRGADSRSSLLARGLLAYNTLAIDGPEKAFALENELIEAYERTWGTGHWRILARLDNQAVLARLTGRRDLELGILRKVYRTSLDKLGDSYITTLWRGFRLADSLRANSHAADALQLAQNTVSRIEALRNDKDMDASTRRSLLGNMSFEPYKLLPQLLVETNNPSGALDASELAKGRTLAEALNLDTLAPIPRPAAASEQKIARSERVVSYFVALHSVLAFVVDANHTTHAVDLGKSDEIKALVDIYSQLLRKPEAEQVLWHWSGDRFALSVVKPDVSARRASREDLSRLLYTKLLAPLEKHLAGAAHIAISPDEWLAMLPFESLLACSGVVCTPWANRVALSTTPSLAVRSLLAQRQTRYSGLRRSQSLIAFGAPDYATAAERRHPRPVTLRHSGMEAEQVRRMFAPTRSRAWLGERASEATLRDLATRGVLQDARVLHVAAHGEINLRKPELSAIELSASGLGLDEDGRITALDWAQFKLRTDLVILSGCSTGTGKILRGEGVLGLPYALFVAGTNGAILTLWQVPDDGAARFVVNMMRHVRDGKSPATALALTKRWYMKRYPNDLTWAAFQYYGA